MGKWISVKDKLPLVGVEVLIYADGYGGVQEATRAREGYWLVCDYAIHPDQVTHWQKLPEPPKQEVIPHG